MNQRKEGLHQALNSLLGYLTRLFSLCFIFRFLFRPLHQQLAKVDFYRAEIYYNTVHFKNYLNCHFQRYYIFIQATWPHLIYPNRVL